VADHRRHAGRVRGKSQNKAEAAQAAGKFKDEIAPVTITTRKGDVTVDQDEYIKKGVTLDSVQKLKPAFAKDGSVTAANASGINDGAAVVILMSEAEASRRGLTPLARIASWASVGVDPAIMGTGPIPASRAALKRPAGRPRTSTSSRPTRLSPRRPVPSTRTWAGTRHRERERRRHRHRPPDRRVGCPRSEHAAL
jgi:acetyl-CoA acetyltransferase